jgi:hypothetical protein
VEVADWVDGMDEATLEQQEEEEEVVAVTVCGDEVDA